MCSGVAVYRSYKSKSKNSMGGSISYPLVSTFHKLLDLTWRKEGSSKSDSDRTEGPGEEGPRRSLQVVMRSSSLLKKLAAYITDGWEPNVSNSPHSKAHMKMVGLNCVEFISDVSDFKAIPPCAFHTYRAYYIYEKFIIHGALKAIPIGPNVADGCGDKLFSGASDLSKVFRSAESEASDFIFAEVGEAFLASQKDTFLDRRRSSISSKIAGDILSTVGKVRSPSNTTSESKRAQALRKLLADTEQTSALRAYLRRVGEEKLLSAYLEAAEIKEILSNAEHSRHGNESHDVIHSIFLHHMNSFYTSFLFQGAAQRIEQSPMHHADFITRLVDCDECNADILSPLQNRLFEHILDKHLEDFTGSFEYRQLLRVGRNSVLLLATDLQTESRAGKKGDQEAQATVFDDQETVIAIKELKELIAEDGTDAAKTLNVQKISALLNFVDAVAKFPLSSYVIETDKNAFFTALFNKHIRRNAQECIDLPEPLRQAILSSIYGSREDVYDGAQKWARQRLALEYWTVVRKEQQRRSQKASAAGPFVNSPDKEGRRKSVAKDVLLHATTMLRSTRRRLSVYISAPKLHPAEAQAQPASTTQMPPEATEGVESSLHRAIRVGISRQGVPCHKGLAHIIEDAECCSLFKEFLEKQEFGSQTLMFLFEVEEYRKLNSPTFQAIKGQALFCKYLHSLAILPVPVSMAARNAIAICIKEKRLALNTFRAATCEVLQYMEMVQLPRFNLSAQAKRMEALIAAQASMQEVVDSGGRVPATVLARRRSSISVAAKGPKVDLLKVLRYQSLTRYFKEFCGQSLNMENLFFYLDAEHYANIPGQGYLKNIAQRMVRKYIANDARFEINISSEVKADILRKIGNPSRSLFRRAQDEVFRLMERDVYGRFALSPLYKQMVQFNEDNPALSEGSQVPAPLSGTASWRGLVRSSLMKMRTVQAIKEQRNLLP